LAAGKEEKENSKKKVLEVSKIKKKRGNRSGTLRRNYDSRKEHCLTGRE